MNNFQQKSKKCLEKKFKLLSYLYIDRDHGKYCIVGNKEFW